MPNKEAAREWFEKADEDERIVEVSLKNKISANDACFHSQQIAEKYLKGFLVYVKQDFDKTHTIERLVESCVKIDPEFAQLKEAAAKLSSFYIETRYPGDFPQFNFTDAGQALQDARRIKEFVLAKL